LLIQSLVPFGGIRFLTWLLANGEEDFTLHAGIHGRLREEMRMSKSRRQQPQAQLRTFCLLNGAVNK
jgi:hypothetical protein